jgi:hypothetical protein
MSSYLNVVLWTMGRMRGSPTLGACPAWTQRVPFSNGRATGGGATGGGATGGEAEDGGAESAFGRPPERREDFGFADADVMVLHFPAWRGYELVGRIEIKN